MDNGIPHTEFHKADEVQVATLESTKTTMVNFVQADGWMFGYFDETAKQAYFLDTTTGTWVVPDGEWSSKDPYCLAADAMAWAEEHEAGY